MLTDGRSGHPGRLGGTESAHVSTATGATGLEPTCGGRQGSSRLPAEPPWLCLCKGGVHHIIRGIELFLWVSRRERERERSKGRMENCKVSPLVDLMGQAHISRSNLVQKGGVEIEFCHLSYFFDLFGQPQLWGNLGKLQGFSHAYLSSSGRQGSNAARGSCFTPFYSSQLQQVQQINCGLRLLS